MASLVIDTRDFDLMLHSLGLGQRGRKRQSHRNYFCADPTGPDDARLAALSERGLVRCYRGPSKDMPYNHYTVTDEGKRAVRDLFGPFKETG